eukprot:s1460_g2.t1
MGAATSVLFLPCEELTGAEWDALETHCRDPNFHCVRMDHGGAPTSEAFEIWKGWVVSVVRNLQTGNRLSAGTLKIVLLLGSKGSDFDRNRILELCEAIRRLVENLGGAGSETQKRMLIKYIDYNELRRNAFDPDKADALVQLADDLLALNAWTDAPYYFYRRATEGYLAFTD